MLNKTVLNEWKKNDDLNPKEIYILNITKTKISSGQEVGPQGGA